MPSARPWDGREVLDLAHPVGDNKANVLRSAAVALWTCTVSFSGPSGIRHSVDVTAESVYEAAALGVSALRKSGWADAVALGTELEIQVREPSTCHRITVHQELLDGPFGSVESGRHLADALLLDEPHQDHPPLHVGEPLDFLIQRDSPIDVLDLARIGNVRSRLLRVAGAFAPVVRQGGRRDPEQPDGHRPCPDR